MNPLGLNDLKHLIRLLEAAGIGSLEIKSAGRGLRVQLQANEITSGGPAVAIDGIHAILDGEPVVIAAELPGVFLRKHPLRRDPFVAPADVAQAGGILGLIRIGQIYAPVVALQSGVVTQVLTADEAYVEFGTPLVQMLAVPSM